MCLTMINQDTSWFDITELPNSDITYVKNTGEEITKVIIDKTSTCVARLFNKHWLSRYPCADSVIYDNGSKIKLFFKKIVDTYSIKHKPTTIKNPQANSILE